MKKELYYQIIILILISGFLLLLHANRDLKIQIDDLNSAIDVLHTSINDANTQISETNDQIRELKYTESYEDMRYIIDNLDSIDEITY